MPPTSSSNKATIRRRKVPSRRRRDGLLAHAKNLTSQSGEDGIIQRLFQLIPLTNGSTTRYCADVGAWDGIHLSNTHSLLVPSETNKTRESWKGILIEADPSRFEELHNLHSPLGNICLCTRISCLEDSPQRLSHLLQENAPHFPFEFDFLSIDVDGPDYWLFLDILSGPYRPKVICVEFNPTIPHDIIYIQERSDDVRQGSSIAALYELAIQYSYTLVETTLYNAFFVCDKLYARYLEKEVPDTSLEALHEVTMGTSLYQLYDGTMKLSGCKKLLWHRIKMNEEKMQLIPVSERHFPFAPPPSSSPPPNIPPTAIDMSPYYTPSPTSSLTKSDCASSLFAQFQTHGFAFVTDCKIPE